MAWPPPVLPINRTNATPQNNTHPADHNAINQAMNDLIPKVAAMDAIDASLQQQINTNAARRGFAAVSGTAVGFSAGQQSRIMLWTPSYDTDGFIEDAGNGLFKVPAGLGGLFAVALQVRSTTTATAMCDLTLNFSGQGTPIAVGYLPSGRAYGPLSVAPVGIAAGQEFFVQFYNGQSTGTVSITATLSVARVSL